MFSHHSVSCHLKAEYTACRSNEEKDIVARSIVEVVASRNGRFLERVESPEQLIALEIPKSTKIAYVLAKEEVVLTKTKQCIRDTVKRSLAGDAGHDNATSPDHKKARRQETETEYTNMPARSSHTFFQNQGGMPAMGAASGFSPIRVLQRYPMLPQLPPFATASSDTSTMTTREFTSGIQSQSGLQQGVHMGNLSLVQQELLRGLAGFSGLATSGNLPPYLRENPPSSAWPAQSRPFAQEATPAGGLAYSSAQVAPSAGLNGPHAMSANERALAVHAILSRLNRNGGTSSLLSPQQESSLEPTEREPASFDAATIISALLRQRAATQQLDASSATGITPQSQLPTPAPLDHARSLLRQAEQLSAAAANQYQQQPLNSHPNTIQQPLATESWLTRYQQNQNQPLSAAYDLASLPRAQQAMQLHTGNLQQRDMTHHFLVRLLLQQQLLQQQQQEVGRSVDPSSMSGPAADAAVATSAETNDNSSSETDKSITEEVD